MANAKQLPSGKWRCQVFDYKDNDGKRHYMSFTADTRWEAEAMAREYQVKTKGSVSRHIDRTLTVGQAVDRYISSKDGTLSPATIRGYRKAEGLYMDAIKDKLVYRLTSEDMQRYVSSISRKVGAKTVSNAYGLINSAVLMFRPDAVFRVYLPKKPKRKKQSPSDRQVVELFNAADDEMKLCIGLAACGSMRRGEICGLKHKDIKGNQISIHADKVQTEDGSFVYKEIPKTSDSARTVSLPAEVIKLIPKGEPEEFIVKVNPDVVTHRFVRLRRQLGIDIRLHDLRHYFASIGAVLGVPDTYLSDFGGWRRNSSVMKEIYQGIIEDKGDHYSNLMVDHFSRILAK